MKTKQKWFYILLIALSLLASFKMVFFSLGLDEEYQVVMAYRNARGDRLFLDMWEPHQSSAFLCTLLMKPYLALFGTTGVVLYLRLCGTVLHLMVSFCLYRVLKSLMEKKYAWILALIYFNTIPKQIILPEFGIMQVWFYTLLSLCLIQYYIKGRKRQYLVLASLALVLNVLSYPSCLILFPFLLLLCFRFSGKDKWRDMGMVTLVCCLCGLGYLGMLFTYTFPAELLATLSHILNGDVTHSLALSEKIFSLLSGCLYVAVLWTACFALAFGVGKWKKLPRERYYYLATILACGLELLFWLPLNKGYENMQIHLAAFTLAGLCLTQNRKQQPLQTTILFSLLRYLIAGALVSLLAVAYLTDLTVMLSIPHAMLAAFFGAALLVLEQHQKKEQSAPTAKWLYATLLLWCLTAILGKGYTMRSGASYHNILQSAGIMRNGPAAGIISNYMIPYVYNCDYEDWQQYMQHGDKVLIVVDQVNNLSTIQYLFKDVEISHFSIVNPTAYDERLLEYWELFPEKAPNVILVDCWYGQLMADPDSWIMQYIENDFGYTQVNDGRYIRIYRK